MVGSLIGAAENTIPLEMKNPGGESISQGARDLLEERGKGRAEAYFQKMRKIHRDRTKGDRYERPSAEI